MGPAVDSHFLDGLAEEEWLPLDGDNEDLSIVPLLLFGGSVRAVVSNFAQWKLGIPSMTRWPNTMIYVLFGVVHERRKYSARFAWWQFPCSELCYRGGQRMGFERRPSYLRRLTSTLLYLSRAYRKIGAAVPLLFSKQARRVRNVPGMPRLQRVRPEREPFVPHLRFRYAFVR